MNRRNKSFAREYMGCRHTPKKEMHWEFIRLACDFIYGGIFKIRQYIFFNDSCFGV